MRRKRIGKREMIMSISEKTDVTQENVKFIVNCFIEEIKKQFREDKMIELRGFGTFYPYHKEPRSYKVPISGEKREMEGRTTLKFKPSHKILIYDL